MKVLECLQVTEFVDIGLCRPYTITITMVKFIIVAIKLITVVEADIGLKRPATLPTATVDQELTFTGEVDIYLIPATLNAITKVDMVGCHVYHFLLVLLTKMFMKIRGVI